MRGSYIKVCGRPTLKGTPCQQTRYLDFETCSRHLTSEQKAFLAAAVPALAEPVEPTEPACWSWTHAPDVCDEPLLVLELWQAGRCAICGTFADRLVTDHDHATGLVRGLLCRSCNTREGGHQPKALRITRYRSRPPAAILGLRIPYVSPFTGEAVAPEGPRSRRAAALSMLRITEQPATATDSEAPHA